MGAWVSNLFRPRSTDVDNPGAFRTYSEPELQSSKGGEDQFLQRSNSAPSKPQGGEPASLAQVAQEPALQPSAAMKKLHYKCRNQLYPRSEVTRFPVPDDKVDWSVEHTEYKPEDHTSQSVLSMPPWADVDFRYTVINGEDAANEHCPQWNRLDGKVNRRSHIGEYMIQDKVPLNPQGRTGVTGRGCLGRWGPNHAADPVVTRWKRDENGEIIVDENGKNIMEFIAVKRRDNGEWALPGGMVDPGEVVSITLKREFGEEALNSLEASDSEKKQIEESVRELFGKGQEIYRGYVDDPRNTDNAWMETVAFLMHDQEGTSVGKFKLNAGDDAVGVQWMELSSELALYASHIDFLHKAAEKLDARW